MFYELLNDMAMEMGFVMLAIWIAMIGLGKRQVLFRRAVIAGALLFGIATYFRMQELAIAFQQMSICMLALGWGCKLSWQLKYARNKQDH